MQTDTLHSLRYPVGEFVFPDQVTSQQITDYLVTIDQLPALLASSVSGLNDQQLDTPYRDGGWTLRQVVHHIADSHMNAYCRFKLAFTEDNPTIKPYEEGRWAETPDSKHGDVAISLNLIRNLHARWHSFLMSLTPDSWSRTFYHPESKRKVRLDECLALYAWHSKHHLAHITVLTKKMGWN